ncbi:MAG: flagellar filament capping protein FliD [Vicinamibacterales bacterium]|nr:flagellar filament capping protein FliD [Vicinamibacterales bacterium]
MGSPISFSGFNQIDFGMILNAVMEQERLPLRTLETQNRGLQGQKTAYTTLASRVSSLETAAAALGKTSAFGGRTATVSDSAAVTVTTSSNSTLGTYDIVVNELARAQVTASVSTFADRDTTEVATGGTLVINGKTVDLGGQARTLDGLVTLINQTEDLGVVASAVQTVNGYQLVLTGTATGTAGAFTVSNQLTGGAGLQFTDTNGDSITGNSPEDNAVQATNAAAVINGIAVTSSTNIIEGAIPGTSVTLHQKDAGKTVTATITRDSGPTRELVDKFIGAYNDLIRFVDDQGAQSRSGSQSSIGRDSMMRALRGTLREVLNADHAVGGAHSRLSAIGVEFTSTGQLQLNKAKFDETIKNGTADLEKLFIGGNGVDGVFKKLEAAVVDYTKIDGLIPSARDRVDAQMLAMGKRLDAMEARLLIRRDALQREFIAADLAISQLNSQMQSLSSIGSGY